MSNNNIYNKLVWLYGDSFGGSQDLTVKLSKEVESELKEGGKLRVRFLSEEAKATMAAKNENGGSVPVAVLEYASPEAIESFKASKSAPVNAKPATKTTTKATASRF